MKTRTPPGRRLQPLQAWLLAALLLAAQVLGLAHRVEHAPGLAAGSAVQAAVFASATAHGHGTGTGTESGLAHEAGSVECRLIDQLAHADALCGSAELAPALPRTALVSNAAYGPALPAGSAAAYLARGPPASA